ncbi:hypothetical protein SAMN05192541_105152 [Bradyrhizobium arachidis]|nr:hypothetical protein SAMN05192541_105152 [Bradyrhizobium arachidis]
MDIGRADAAYRVWPECSELPIVQLRKNAAWRYHIVHLPNLDRGAAGPHKIYQQTIPQLRLLPSNPVERAEVGVARTEISHRGSGRPGALSSNPVEVECFLRFGVCHCLLDAVREHRLHFDSFSKRAMQQFGHNNQQVIDVVAFSTAHIADRAVRSSSRPAPWSRPAPFPANWALRVPRSRGDAPFWLA